MKNCLLFILFGFLLFPVFGQKDTTVVKIGTGEIKITTKDTLKRWRTNPFDPDLYSSDIQGIATAIHGNIYPMVELGYFQYKTHGGILAAQGTNFTMESYFIKEPIFAPKFTLWYQILFYNFGISVPYYFNLTGEQSLRIRPEIGFGLFRFKLNYSANIAITNRNMPHVGSHYLSLVYYIPRF
ncbi:MAG: hypothetical protein GY827_03115 [Cytophagales bacterium]|nr:hypothetical protein [Cytophagales bacterium]